MSGARKRRWWWPFPDGHVAETPGLPAITPVATSVTAFVGEAAGGPVDEPVALASFAEFDRAFGGLWAESRLGFAVRDYFDNGGSDAVVVRCAASDDSDGRDAALLTAVQALDAVDVVNLLVIPPPVSGVLNPATVIPAAAAYCEQRRALLLVDGPAAWVSAGAALQGFAGLATTSANMATYFPALLAPNPLRGGALERFPVTGAVAGVMARTDRERGVWKAAAGPGATLAGAPRLAVPLTDDEIGQLNPQGINCLRALPGGGVAIWGARMPRGNDGVDSSWPYIPMRRTVLHIEESLARGLAWVSLEPNVESTWARVREQVADFLHGVWRRGAFPGAKAEEAFFVRCGEGSTMAAADIAAGVVRLEVGLSLLKPAEFTVLRLELAAGP